MKHHRLTQILSAACVAGILLSCAACKKKKETTASETTTVATTTTEETTTTETTTKPTEETTTVATTTTTETSETTTETTTVPTTTTVKETPAPETTTTAAPETTTEAPTEPPTEPETTPEPEPETTPEETEAEKKISIPGIQSKSASGAAKDAIADYCGSYEFTDDLMSAEKTRANYARDCGSIGHSLADGSGCGTPQAEACALFGAAYYIDGNASFSDGYINITMSSSQMDELYSSGSWHYYWADHDGNYHVYSSMYDCAYALTSYMVQYHTPALSTDSISYYGVGCAGSSENSYVYEHFGLEIPEYEYYIYIGGES